MAELDTKSQPKWMEEARPTDNNGGISCARTNLKFCRKRCTGHSSRWDRRCTLRARTDHGQDPSAALHPTTAAVGSETEKASSSEYEDNPEHRPKRRLREPQPTARRRNDIPRIPTVTAHEPQYGTRPPTAARFGYALWSRDGSLDKKRKRGLSGSVQKGVGKVKKTRCMG